MSSIKPVPVASPDASIVGQIVNRIVSSPIHFFEMLLGLTCSLPALRAVRFLTHGDDLNVNRSWIERLGRVFFAYVIASTLTAFQVIPIFIGVFAFSLALYFQMLPDARKGFNLATFMQSEDPGPLLVRAAMQAVMMIVNMVIDRFFFDAMNDSPPDLPVYRFLMWLRLLLSRAIVRVGSTMILMGLSLLPLSSLLLALPAIDPSEAVLSDTIAPVRSFWRGLMRRVVGLVAFFIIALALLAFATEIISLFGLQPGTYYGTFARNLLPESLVSRLPLAMIDHWPYVLMVVYILDLAILMLIGKIPIQYNLRNLVVRWPITAMTAVAFIVVVGMLTVMLAFVTGMNKTTGDSGYPGNVIILSDGATDELFSNLGYGGDVDNIARIIATEDENDQPLPKPAAVKQSRGKDGSKSYLASKEIYSVINQTIPGSDRRRFVQLRIITDADVTAAVHNIGLLAGDWFGRKGTDDEGRIEAVLGEGVAGTLGADKGQSRLEVGDTFELGDLQWIVAGIMKTEGTTYGSEIWCQKVNIVTEKFGKQNYTTLVMRVHDDKEATARALAYHIRWRYQSQKLKAMVETEYFAEMNKSGQQFLQSIIAIAIVMAIGGVFCVMITMFSAIAQRTKDIGVMRLLGFKRWQVLVSFLLESMGIAVIGGLLGLALGAVCHGFSVTSVASSGQGGGKSVAAKLIVNQDVILVGLLFTLVMGRLGGLVPALSAMRMKILESLR